MDNDEKSTEEHAEEALKRLLAVDSYYKDSEHETAVRQNHLISRNVLQEELGKYGAWGGAQYHLDETTRDRLIAHARQDASFAVLNAVSAIRLSSETKRLVRILIGLVAFSSLILVVLAAKLFGAV